MCDRPFPTKQDFRQEEPMYRRLALSEVVDGMVFWDSIDPPDTSFNRHDYSVSPPGDVLTPEKWPHHNGIAVMLVSEKPQPIQREEEPPVTIDFGWWHCPDQFIAFAACQKEENVF